jgi:hypothetical protein
MIKLLPAHDPDTSPHLSAEAAGPVQIPCANSVKKNASLHYPTT